MEVPALLIPPHIFYLIIFAATILIEARALLINRPKPRKRTNPAGNKKGIG